MEQISVFDMLKIGVGPSSSHTLGPWRAAQQWLQHWQQAQPLSNIQQVKVSLYGSLALTGKGHATDVAIVMGLLNKDPETIHADDIHQALEEVKQTGEIRLGGSHAIPFHFIGDIHFCFQEKLPFHANGMRFTALTAEGPFTETFYSIGGGFVVQENDTAIRSIVPLPYPCQVPDELAKCCARHNLTIAEMVMQNERVWQDQETIENRLAKIWQVMKHCVYEGCHTAELTLPGGLEVSRRANRMHNRLMGEVRYHGIDEWMDRLTGSAIKFQDVLRWISCFAIAVNEQNAGMGRVVTAPTNGAAGVIPAVLMYYICFSEEQVNQQKINNFLMVAGEIGSFFKKGATLSAAMGGCQAEIGVSSAMAAGALTEGLGGTVPQSLMAAEIAMEHHLGLTCDPVGGLVQVPCIERNSMGAIKAITASRIALESDPTRSKVSLDSVIKTMWETAQDMNHKYKETSEGGLAANISVRLPEC